jgi:hypothetical protein
MKPDPLRKFFIDAPVTSTDLAKWIDRAGRGTWTDTKNHPSFLSQLFSELRRLRPEKVVLKFLTANGIYSKEGFRPTRAWMVSRPDDIYGDVIYTVNRLAD